jgi:protein-S-isoprenylcysteine O-methyltransferase Ste14
LRSLLRLGIAGALFLALYTVFLGHKGEMYNLLRRFGVSLNLGLTCLAQLLVVWRLHRLRDRAGETACPAWILQAKTWLVTVLVLLGLGSIPVSNFIADKDPVENAIEWTFCLLMSGFYLLTALAWRDPGRLARESS